MTPISFALEILLDCETIEEAHKKCRKYIKQLEAAPTSGIRQTAIVSQSTATQAPSTQRLIDQHGPIAAPPIPAIRMPPAVVDKETGRAMVPTGNGTSGPRKF